MSARSTMLLAVACASLLASGCGVSRTLGDAMYDLRHLEFERLNPFDDSPPPLRVDGPTVAEVIADLPEALPAGARIIDGVAGRSDARVAGTASGAIPAVAATDAPPPAAVAASPAALDAVIARYEAVLPALTDEAARFAVRKRVTDLKLERSTVANDAAGYAEVIAAYDALLRETAANGVADDGNSTPAIRYQLARARDLAGQGAAALADLDALIAGAGPGTDPALLREARFRRAEAAFSRGDYAGAARDYAEATGPDSKYGLHASYMLGWSHFRAGDQAAALQAMFDVIAQLGARPASGLAASERELLADALRATVLALERTGGVGTLAEAMRERDQPVWQVLPYEALGAFYLDGRRFQDAAAAFERFETENPPLAVSAPAFALRAVEALATGGLPTEVQGRKPRFVQRYGAGSAFHERHGDEGIAPYRAALLSFIDGETARLHALAQRDRTPQAYAEAASWYRRWLLNFDRTPEAMPLVAGDVRVDDAAIGERLFLLGEALAAGGAVADSVPVFRGLVQRLPTHPRAREAGSAAVLGLTALVESEPERARQLLAAELDFADRFGDDPRAPDVQLHAARSLLTRADNEGAALAAESALARWQLDAPRGGLARRIAAEARLARDELPAAEVHFAAARSLASDATEQQELEGRLLATVGRQAENAEKAGELDAAVAHLRRLAAIAPQSEPAIAGGLNVASLYLQAGRPAEAAAQLEASRTAHPAHPLMADVPLRLAELYERLQQPGRAADELLAVAASTSDAAQARNAHYHAAELLLPVDAVRAESVLSDYVQRFPMPIGFAADAVARLRVLTAARAPALARWQALQMQLYDEAMRSASPEAATELARPRALAADVAFELAAPHRLAFEAIPLSQPLAQSLGEKRAALDVAIAAYERAGAYGESRIVTAATRAIGELYGRLADELRASPRPEAATDEGLARYETALATRAADIDAQAIGVHRLNAARARDGAWDDSIAASFAALARLDAAAFARQEQLPPPPGIELLDEADGAALPPSLALALQAWRAGDHQAAERAFVARLGEAADDAAAQVGHGIALVALDDPAAALQRLDAASPVPDISGRCALDVARGVALRRLGRLRDAEAGYRACVAADALNATAWRNLGVLHELYLQDDAAALEAYRRAARAAINPDGELAGWIARLEAANVVSHTP